ncbi:LOW QUALITY PROTEIN: hypothetical protein Cgig2_004186 [Carnegiea gigantea]|uniref:Uncharacterized protein n=1 Tax=Carnegiea gigantea TaxID=171969 RepID=A0A9Q1QPM8_9CARY|nr:LOW QUALITY PROTEIN: hypothetical protein Cgig2_004186 [Carnegiea gigantea]
MGNCQAIDAATLVIQHPDGKAENMYWPIPASQIMKMNPGHYVALLITTTISHTTTSAAMGRSSVRITRVKLLRPTETLALGHVYRLISTQEVMKGLVAKKEAKMRKNGIGLADSEALNDAEKFATRSQQDVKTHQYYPLSLQAFSQAQSRSFQTWATVQNNDNSKWRNKAKIMAAIPAQYF